MAAVAPQTYRGGRGLRVAVEGCGHGTLDAIYAAVQTASRARGWAGGVDLLIIGGDFQAVRNAADLAVMSCPVRYRALGDFHAYYAGTKTAPCLTLFVGGNHEASSHLWELYYGGWVAPNIYYLGAANVVRVAGLRIAGLSGIWKGYNYNKAHYERLPYSPDDVKSIYHVRELDVRKLLLLRTQVDIGISHDWPRAIERYGNAKALWRMKPDFERESKDGTLGNQAAKYVLDRLRPPYWFSAHMHCRFAAIKTFERGEEAAGVHPDEEGRDHVLQQEAPVTQGGSRNADEIDLDMDEDEDDDGAAQTDKITPGLSKPAIEATNTASISADIRAQLPAAFSRPAAPPPSRHEQPGQPTPPTITNRQVRFLALDKCLPGRKFLQLHEIHPYSMEDRAAAPAAGDSNATRDSNMAKDSNATGNSHTARDTNTSVPTTPSFLPNNITFEYDPEWLAITRVLADELVLGGDRESRPPPDKGEAYYRPLIEHERDHFIQTAIIDKGLLAIPMDFIMTAPPFVPGEGSTSTAAPGVGNAAPHDDDHGPREYDNPQTQRYCDLVGIENRFRATPEEREERMRQGPMMMRGGGGGGGGHHDRGRGGGRGGRGYGPGGGRGQTNGHSWNGGRGS